jgi:hypothetical protein
MAPSVMLFSVEVEGLDTKVELFDNIVNLEGDLRRLA